MAQPVRLTVTTYQPKGIRSHARIAGREYVFSVDNVCHLQITEEGKVFRSLKAALRGLGWPTNKLRVWREGECFLCDVGSRRRLRVNDVWAQLQTVPPPHGSTAISDRLARLTPVPRAAAAEVVNVQPGKSLP